MSIEEIKDKVAGLPADQQDHLAAFLVHLRHRRDPALKKTPTEHLDDPKHWISLKDLKEKWS
jgi:hypothetical protein